MGSKIEGECPFLVKGIFIFIFHDEFVYIPFPRVDGPAQYHEGYSKLRSWAYSSLDQYQVINLLPPFFFLSFFSHMVPVALSLIIVCYSY